MSENFWLLMLGTAITMLALMVLVVIRLVTAGPDEIDDESDPCRRADAIAAQLPADESIRDPIRQELWAAGYYRPGVLRDYLLVRGVMTVAPLIAAVAFAVVAGPDQAQNILIGGAVVSLLGFSVPRVFLMSAGRDRQARIASGLPVGIDLMVLSMSAGLSIPEALRRTSIEVNSVYPDLADELRITAKHARLHSVEYSLDRWSDRTQSKEVRALAVLLIQSERLGTNTVETLQEFSENFRTLQRQHAEAKANRTSFWMLFPTIFCLWVASAIVLVGPPYLQFWQVRELQMNQLIDEAQQNVQGYNNNGRVAPQPSNPAP